MSTRIQATKNNSLGFTLIELLVVIGILAVLALIAIPAFSAWMPEYRLKQAARELYSNLQRAKMGAVRANESWGILFVDGANPEYRIYSLGANRSWDLGTGDDQLQNITIKLSDYKGVKYGRALTIPKVSPGDLGTDIKISYKTPDKVVVFTNRGTVENPCGFVYLSNGKGTCYAVGTPSPAGVVVLRKWNGSSWQ
jgi:type IV fimbrial biogenesis protein FimT